MRKIFGFILAFSFVSIGLNAQHANYQWEFGAKLGGANYLGDIGGEFDARPFLMDMKIEKSQPGFGFYARKDFFPWLSVNAGFQYSRIAGADSLSKIPTRFSRNLSFRNHITELYARGELNFLSINDIGRTGRYLHGARFYAFMGAAVFHHNPQAFYNDEWINLRPLQTEGVKYSAIQYASPFGFGASVTFARVHRFGIEATWHWTFTDYLDDVSTNYIAPQEHETEIGRILADRSFEVNPEHPNFLGTAAYSLGTQSSPNNPAPRGNSANNDSYATLFITYGYVLAGKQNFKRKKYDFVKAKPVKIKSRAKF